MSPDASDFLAALSFSAGEDNPIQDCSIFDFHPDLVSAVENFCQGFREYLETLDLNPDDIQDSRSFGGNVYFSLSGHGCGFWDDSGPWGDVFQAALENYAGGKYRFETLAENCDFQPGGKINLCFIPRARPEYLKKYFGIPDLATVPPLSLTIAANMSKEETRISPGPPAKFSPPPFWEGDLLKLHSFTAEKFREVLETIG
jgi:hypothetical protein